MDESKHFEARKADPAKREKKDKVILVRVSAAEAETIKGNAILAGLSVSEYLRKLGTGHQVQARFDKDEKRNLQGIGTNMNQLAAYANKGFFYEKPLLEVLEQLKKILKS
jgi:hypothetical protein